ncbi:hypothetical protein [Litorimonas sp.]|uniref:hypothetical protein n=1 Tax=Litorimonas sp. TaxID=1892381 RepID=UPI003A852D4A
MTSILKRWKKYSELPRAEYITFQSKLTHEEMRNWLSVNLENSFSSFAAMKSAFSSRKKRNFIGSFDDKNFELTLIKDQSRKNLNFSPPLVSGSYDENIEGLSINLEVGIKRPYWFWRLSRCFLWVFMLSYLLVPLIGVSLSGSPASALLLAATLLLISAPFVALIVFYLFDFLPLKLVRKTQSKTIEVLKQEFEAK